MEKYTLIAKYLSGNATSQEEAELTTWRKANENNEAEFQELNESWLLAHHSSSVPDKEQTWQRIRKGIYQMKTYTLKDLYRAVGIAASIALLIGFTLSISFFPEKETSKLVIVKAPKGQKAETILPDGSTVLLNSGSQLAYTTDFSRTNRAVTVKGEAFFDVVKDPKHQFLVTVGNIKVAVHGTAFNVKNYSDNKNIEVALLRGSISILSADKNKVMVNMHPNQKVVVPRSDCNKLILASCDAEEEALWHVGKLKIQGEDLTNVVHKMEKWYGVNIQLRNMPANKKYWMTIKTESFKEMLEIINKITPINYSVNGEEAIIVCK